MASAILNLYDVAANIEYRINAVMPPEITSGVNEISTWKISAPQSYYELINDATYIGIEIEDDGEIMRGKVDFIEQAFDDNGVAILNISGSSLAEELLFTSTLYGTNVPENFEDGLDALLAGTNGPWTYSITGSLTGRAWRADAMTAWEAVLKHVQQAGGYIVDPEDDSRELLIYETNPSSGMTFTNRQPAGSSTGIQFESLKRTIDRRHIVNSISPIGANDGDILVDLEHSSRSGSPYTIHSIIPTQPKFVSGYFINASVGFTWTGTFSQGWFEPTVTGRNRAAVIVIMHDNTDGDVQSLTWKADHQFVRWTRSVSGNFAFEVWVLINPPLSKHNLIGHSNELTFVMNVGSVGFHMFWMNFMDVDIRSGGGSIFRQPTPANAFDTGVGTAPGGALSNPSEVTAGDLILSAIRYTANVPDDNPPLVEQLEWLNTDTMIALSRVGFQPGVDSAESVFWTLSGSATWKAMTLAIKGAVNYYIEDATSIAAYNRRRKVIPYKDVLQTGNLESTSDALYDSAAYDLDRLKNPITIINNLNPINLPWAGWKVGYTFDVDFQPIDSGLPVEHSGIIITKRVQRFTAAGVRQWQLTLATMTKTPGGISSQLGQYDSVARLRTI